MKNKQQSKKTQKPAICVKNSSIHGKGLFATQEIQKDEIIGAFQYRKAKKDGPYVLWLSEEHGYTVLDDFKYINHSNHANAAYYDDFTVVAIKTIQLGDEITHYYGEDWSSEDWDQD